MSVKRALWSAAGGALVLGIGAAAVSSPLQPDGTTTASKNLSGVFSVIAKFVAKVVDPTQPLIAQRSGTSAPSTAPATNVTKTTGQQPEGPYGPIALTSVSLN